MSSTVTSLIRPELAETLDGIPTAHQPMSAQLHKTLLGLATMLGVESERLYLHGQLNVLLQNVLQLFLRPPHDRLLFSALANESLRKSLALLGLKAAPLQREPWQGFDLDGILSAWNSSLRVLYLERVCSSTGVELPLDVIDELCESLDRHAVVIIDERSLFASHLPSCVERLSGMSNSIVLGSPFRGLGSPDAGFLVASSGLVQAIIHWVEPVLPCLPGQALHDGEQIVLKDESLVGFRADLLLRMQELESVDRVWSSEGDFLPFRPVDPAVCSQLAARADVTLGEPTACEGMTGVRLLMLKDKGKASAFVSELESLQT